MYTKFSSKKTSKGTLLVVKINIWSYLISFISHPITKLFKIISKNTMPKNIPNIHKTKYNNLTFKL